MTASRTMQRRSHPPSGHSVVTNTPPASSIDPARTALRTALSQAISGKADADARVDQLAQATLKAIDQRPQFYHDMVEADNKLRAAQLSDPIDRAEAFVSGIEMPPSPALKQLEDASEATKKALADHEQILQAINRESDFSLQSQSAAKVKLGQAIADILAPVFPVLLQRMNHHWVELRTLRAVCDLIAQSCASQLPDAWLTAYQESQPLQADRVGYPVNQDLINEWQSALARLAQDGDTTLPE